MLHRIRRKGTTDRPRAPVDSLLECHERIRTFLAIASNLAIAHDAPGAEIAEAATRVHRYFTLALPLHEEDEERSLAPRLLALDPRLEAVLATMADQHAHAHVALASLVPLWERIAGEPESIGVALPVLERRTTSLRGFLEAHLALEERAILPRIPGLSEASREEILDEMRERR